jgi:hypothetical protein
MDEPTMEESLRTTLAALSLAAGLGLICCHGAAAFPAGGGEIHQAATATSGVEHVQYAERNGRYRTTKCYREFVFGPYRCHSFRNW